ncbi:hypothetical protein PSECIP111854_01268 [Pseudoalteromonas sp. CIP111854]|uniref:DUF1579 domain-containing protein n=1 Tax=Pseudoalteromonas holothuriae TaxID=2963714 RepID=A0A9W4QUK5_9GAMM|nr:hypothetical protein [Pseudoalteromonas sp. CIP111854]CAH9053939.1 hypothetical protein PSECIP111854_01268 [Pseudoalteromonas sp. CIP111854]
MLKLPLLIGCFFISTQSLAKCDDKVFNEFDFWLGNWQVFTADNKLVGNNVISKSHGGCVVKEQYTALSGFSGESLNIFDTTTRRWHQTWVDNSGLLLQLNGGLSTGSMSLSGKRQNKSGTFIFERITWTPNKDGTVRQLWQSKTHKQAKWQTVFDGLYKRVNK